MKTEAVASAQKGQEQIAAEWDAAADRRHEQIISRKDLSFWHVLAPAIMEMLRSCDTRRFLDVGCGTGELTHLVAPTAKEVVGVDISARSVEIARQHNAAFRNVTFAVKNIEQIHLGGAEERFTVVVAAMTLMTVPDLKRAVAGLASALIPGGSVVATITHPCFWPSYWGYNAAPWFAYEKEIFIEAPFRISLETIDRVTTHIHRPLTMYLNVAAENGLSLDAVRELMPPPHAVNLYPDPR